MDQNIRPSDTIISLAREDTPFMVCVYCGSRFGNNPLYREHAVALANFLAEDGRFGLIYGDGPGLMRAIAEPFEKFGRKLWPVTTDHFDSLDSTSEGNNYRAKNINIRKDTMRSGANASVVLAGGLGTEDEVGDEMVIHQQAPRGMREHEGPEGPLLFLNTLGVYDLKFAHWRDNVARGFMNESDLRLYESFDTPEAVYRKLIEMRERETWMPKGPVLKAHVQEYLHPHIAWGDGGEPVSPQILGL